MATTYRALTQNEYEQLTAQGCTADNWTNIVVADAFCSSQIRNCGFYGRVEIAEDVTLRNIGRLSNYTIEQGVTIENISVLEVTEPSSFGNGVMVASVNENGGRAIPIFSELTAQVAYIMTMYRHRKTTINHLEQIIHKNYTLAQQSSMGTIASGAKVVGCGIIHNVNIGADAIIEGAAYLENGTIHSFSNQKTYIGAGVNIRNFIICGNSSIDCGSILERCFFANGTRASALTAVDSLFFAGSHCDNSELCSVFAGPYTISHHKSTLLIAGMFSFFNAGSGTNQSNHLLKSGPVHQGIHQRGCKYGSDAYMMLPALDGAFTTIIGRHKSHPDTESFPFSILIEKDGDSWLLPAANLAACGPERDFTKWPQRDKRDHHSLDIINFEECNPFLAERIERAIAISEELLAKENDILTYKRMRIKNSMLRRGMKLYRLALDKYIGAMLSTPSSTTYSHDKHWCDMAGMYAPLDAIEAILNKIDSTQIDSITELSYAINQINNSYNTYAYGWALEALVRQLGHTPSPEDIATAITQGIEASDKLHSLTQEDLRTEQNTSFSVGYGIDAENEETRLSDFHAVRGL